MDIPTAAYECDYLRYHLGLGGCVQTGPPVVGIGIAGGGGEYCKRYCRGRYCRTSGKGGRDFIVGKLTVI